MTLADKISSIRIVLVSAFISFLIYSRHQPGMKHWAVVIFIAVVGADFLDGFIARITKEKTVLGI